MFSAQSGESGHAAAKPAGERFRTLGSASSYTPLEGRGCGSRRLAREFHSAPPRALGSASSMPALRTLVTTINTVPAPSTLALPFDTAALRSRKASAMPAALSQRQEATQRPTMSQVCLGQGPLVSRLRR